MDWSQQGIRNALTANLLQAAHRSFTGISSMVKELSKPSQLHITPGLCILTYAAMSAAADAAPAVAVAMSPLENELLKGRVLRLLYRASCGSWLSRELADAHYNNSRYAIGVLFLVNSDTMKIQLFVTWWTTQSANWGQAVSSGTDGGRGNFIAQELSSLGS